MTEYHKGENYVSEMHAVELMDGVVKGDLMVKQKRRKSKRWNRRWTLLTNTQWKFRWLITKLIGRGKSTLRTSKTIIWEMRWNYKRRSLKVSTIRKLNKLGTIGNKRFLRSLVTQESSFMKLHRISYKASLKWLWLINSNKGLLEMFTLTDDALIIN